MARLFGINPGDAVLIDYDRRDGVGGSSDLGRSVDGGSRGAGAGVMEALPEAMQEELLLEDLLYALMGFAGRCVCMCMRRLLACLGWGGGRGSGVAGRRGGLLFFVGDVLGVLGKVGVCGA